MTLKRLVALAILLPAAALTLLAGHGAVTALGDAARLDRLAVLADLTRDASAAIGTMQRERGLSVALIAAPGEAGLEADLGTRRGETDAALDRLAGRLASPALAGSFPGIAERGAALAAARARIAEHRDAVDGRRATKAQAIATYSTAIADFVALFDRADAASGRPQRPRQGAGGRRHGARDRCRPAR